MTEPASPQGRPSTGDQERHLGHARRTTPARCTPAPATSAGPRTTGVSAAPDAVPAGLATEPARSGLGAAR